jgi:hypothetical protein
MNEMTVCPSCGFKNEESEGFCRNPACGAFLGWGRERVDANGRGARPAASTSIDEDTQPFDTAAEVRRPDPSGPAAGPVTRTEPATSADPFATGPFAPDQTQPVQQPAPPADAPGGRAGQQPERRVLSAAETAWGTRDFVHRPEPPKPAEPPPQAEAPAQAEAPPWAQASPWTEASPWAEAPPPLPAAPSPPPGAGAPVPRRAQPAAPPARSRSGRPHSSFPSEEQLLKRPPLWERLLRRTPIAVPGEGTLRRSPSTRERERRRALLRFGVLLVVIVLVGAGLWLASSRKPAGVASGGGNPGTTASPALTAVHPGRVVASTQSGSRLATNVLDGKTSTFWSRSAPSNDDQPFLRFFFERRVRLARMSIAAGASGAEFSQRPRPRQIELRFSDGSTIRTTLADKAGFQTVSFPPREIDVMRLVILSTYPSAGPQRTSIREIRFFAAKS